MAMRGLDRAIWSLLLVSACTVTACSDDKKNDTPMGGSAGSGSAGSAGKAGGGNSSGGSPGESGSGGTASGGKADGGGAGKGGAAGSNANGGKGGSTEAGSAGVGPGGAGGMGDGGENRGGGGEGGVGPVQVECGNGEKEAGEECEPPSSSTCTERCQTVQTKACVDCEQAGACSKYSDICRDVFLGEDDRSICYEVQQCVYDSNCADGSNNVQHCFCGTFEKSAECIAAPEAGAGAPNGACAAIIREAMSVDGQVASNAEVLTRLIDEAFPGGAALARVNCDRQDKTCIATCGY